MTRIRVIGAILAIVAGVLLTCLAGRAQLSEAAPTYYRDVLPILQKHCEVCHRDGGIAPISFADYERAGRYADAIRAVTEIKSMPPWFAVQGIGRFSNDPSLSSAEIATLAAWAAAKAPAGNSHDAPAARAWAAGWSIPQTDLVVKMTQPVELPASGEVDYTYEIVPTHFAEDRWVQMAEVLPSARANVHHAVVYIRPPNSNWLRHAPVGKAFPAHTLIKRRCPSSALPGGLPPRSVSLP